MFSIHLCTTQIMMVYGYEKRVLEKCLMTLEYVCIFVA